MAKTEAAMEKRILDEIVGKVEEYEAGMSVFMAEVGEWADLYKVKRPQRKQGAFSNPRLTEFFRACNALSTLMYRMMTARDPFFAAVPVGFDADYDQIDTLIHVLKTQHKYSKYKQNLLKSCSYLIPFGTVIVQEDYRVMGVSPFGRKIPVTAFTPRVLDQVFFDRGTIDIDDADWIATSDITSANALLRIAEDTADKSTTWNKKALEAAARDKEEANTINERVLRRLTRDGTDQESAYSKKKELVMYYGKLDTMNDGVEYVAAVINRKFLVRFHANKFQHGKRNFRIAKWVDFDTPTGLGLGQLLAPLHRSLDANRQKAQDSISMSSYNMWKRRKDTVADESLQIRPLQIIDVENMDDIAPLNVPVVGAEAALKLEDVLKQEFRAASGATDTLQAIITDATASEVSLAQNEAMRNISVKAELSADPLVREHLEIQHWNNAQNIKSPFSINKAGISRKVYPSDLQVDLDFETKVTTDKDFKPQRLEKLISLIQILVSTKSSHPDQLAISILPLVKQVAFMLDVNPEDIIQRPGAPNLLGAGDIGGMGAALVPGSDLSTADVAGTPVGNVMVSP